jgi:3'-5' exoribonuclease
VNAGTYRKKVFCADLEVGDEVQDVFCIARAERRTGKNGPYLTLEFVDRSGRIPGVAWNEADALAEVLVEGGFASIRGRITMFREAPQIEVVEAEPAPDALDPAEYLAGGPVPPEESIVGIRLLAASMVDPHLKGLVLGFLDDAEFAARFAAAPAAKVHHHAYVGGLAEHTRSVMELCALAAEHYGDLDRDLLLAGAFFHDVGKTAELAVEPGFPYTEEGSLLGHIALGFAIVRERIARVAGFPPDRAADLGHMILSHQGELEWGSPVQPQTLEALVLHFLDNLDSKVGTARPHLADIDSGRTGWVKSLRRALFRRAAPSPPAMEGDTPPDITGGGSDAGQDASRFDELDRPTD